jgi:integrase
MPRKNSKALTDPGIGKIGKAPKGKRAERFDALAPGLSLRTTDTGTKSWGVYYRFDGKHQRLTIGGWPAVAVAEARERAREIKDQAKAGIDPKVVKRAAADAVRTEAAAAARNTFGRIAEIYITRECSRLKRGGEYESAIRRELLPKWQHRQMTDLRRGDLTEITDALIDAGKPMAGRRIHEITKRIFNWSMDRGDIELSPFAAMRPPVKKEPRDRVLKDDEIKALWKTWGEMAYPFGSLQKLLLLLGQRRGEIAEMRWSEVAPDGRTWIIPAARNKMGREHLVPLSDAAVAILEDLPRFNGGDFVFTSTSGARPVSGFSKCAARTIELSGVSGWTLHDLRRTCRTGLARLGVPEIVAERVVNHAKQGLVKVYDLHAYEDEKREALARWAQEVTNLVTPPPANVVAMKTVKSA